MKTAAAALLFACVLALASCGGGVEDRDRDAEDTIGETIQISSRSDDPANCTRLSTLRFLEQTTKLDGEAAITACEEETANSAAEDARQVTVSEIEVEGESATATASFAGSSFDGQTIRLALVERDRRWKLDELLGFVDLNAEKLVTEMGRELMRRMRSPQEAGIAACMVGLLEEMREVELEELMLEPGSDRMLDLAQACASRSTTL